MQPELAPVKPIPPQSFSTSQSKNCRISYNEFLSWYHFCPGRFFPAEDRRYLRNSMLELRLTLWFALFSQWESKLWGESERQITPGVSCRAVLYSAVPKLDSASLHLARGHSSYEKVRLYFCLHASMTQKYSRTFSHCSLFFAQNLYFINFTSG